MAFFYQLNYLPSIVYFLKFQFQFCLYFYLLLSIPSISAFKSSFFQEVYLFFDKTMQPHEPKTTLKKEQKYQIPEEIKKHISVTIKEQFCDLMKLGIQYFNGSASFNQIMGFLKLEDSHPLSSSSLPSSELLKSIKNENDSFVSFSDNSELHESQQKGSGSRESPLPEQSSSYNFSESDSSCNKSYDYISLQNQSKPALLKNGFTGEYNQTQLTSANNIESPFIENSFSSGIKQQDQEDHKADQIERIPRENLIKKEDIKNQSSEIGVSGYFGEVSGSLQMNFSSKQDCDNQRLDEQLCEDYPESMFTFKNENSSEMIKSKQQKMQLKRKLMSLE